MDRITIRGLKAETIIGHHAWERRVARPLLIDLDIACDVARAAKSDALKDALDYDAVARATVAFVEESRFTLVETLAERLAEKLMKDFGTPWLRLTVHKPGAIAGAQSVAVTVEREV